jgi:F-type H+-transporting ATPase subunit delta
MQPRSICVMTENDKPDLSFASDVSALRIARVYAEALYAAAEKAGQIDEVLQQLDSLIDDVYRQQPQLETLFSSAAVGVQRRREAIDKAFSHRCSEVFLSFLQVLNTHDRLDLIRAIRHSAHEIDDEKKRRLRVQVQTAVPLPDNIRQALTERIRVAYEMEPILDARIVPEILGGMKIRIGDVQVDGTVRNYLNEMKAYILERSSHEIQSRRDRIGSAN